MKTSARDYSAPTLFSKILSTYSDITMNEYYCQARSLRVALHCSFISVCDSIEAESFCAKCDENKNGLLSMRKYFCIPIIFNLLLSSTFRINNRTFSEFINFQFIFLFTYLQLHCMMILLVI